MKLFSEEVSDAMQMYKNDALCPELQDADATIAFIKRINKVIKAMTSLTPVDALRSNEYCKNKEVNFLLK